MPTWFKIKSFLFCCLWNMSNHQIRCTIIIWGPSAEEYQDKFVMKTSFIRLHFKLGGNENSFQEWWLLRKWTVRQSSDWLLVMSLISNLVNRYHACNRSFRGDMVNKDSVKIVYDMGGSKSASSEKKKVLGQKNTWEEAILVSKRNESRWLHISHHFGNQEKYIWF